MTEQKSENPEKEFAEIIEAPCSLRDKTEVSSDGDASHLFDAAEQVVAEQAKYYIAQVNDDFSKLSDLVDKATAESDARPELLNDVFGLVHNMKGQGGSFGYDLVSRISASLCDFLRGISDADDADMRVIKAHVDALDIVITHRIPGNGGEMGRKLIGSLEGLTGPRHT